MPKHKDDFEEHYHRNVFPKRNFVPEDLPLPLFYLLSACLFKCLIILYFHYGELYSQYTNKILVINVKGATTEFPVERDPCVGCPNMQNECWPVKLTCQHPPPPCPHSYCPTSRHAIFCITRPRETLVCEFVRNRPVCPA